MEEVARLFPHLDILGLLGVGGMGAVYRARQPALDRWVALKLLPSTSTGGPNFAERFNREARALARLSHPNIVSVHEFGQVEGRHFFLMEFVDGANLRQLERAGRLSPREVLQLIPQICDALQYAHDEGVVHRDIKPENVLIDRKGRVKIADFGLAKILGTDPETLRLTAEGQVMGTPHYMAPEQFSQPLEVDHRADIYSLGVVFYEMLTGDLPMGRFLPPSRKVQVDVRLDDVVLRALENDRTRRYQHVSEVKSGVATITETPDPTSNPDPTESSKEPPSSVPSVVPPTETQPSPRPWTLLIVATVFLVSGATAAWDMGSSWHRNIYNFNVSVLALPIGLGVLRLRPWWRKAALGYLGLTLGLVSLFSLLTLLAPMVPSLGEFHPLNQLTVFGQPIDGPTPILVVLAALTLVVALPIWMGRVLTRPPVKALFQRRGFERPQIEWGVLLAAILVPYGLTGDLGRHGSGTVAQLNPGTHTLMANPPRGGRVELVAVSGATLGSDLWWRPDGTIITNQYEIEGLAENLAPAKQINGFAFRVMGQPAGTPPPFIESIPVANISTGGLLKEDGQPLISDGWPLMIAWSEPTPTATIRLGYRWEPWSTVARHHLDGRPTTLTPQAQETPWQATLNHASDDGTNLFLTLILGPETPDWKLRVVTVDREGKEHLQQGASGINVGSAAAWTLSFPNLTQARVDEIQVQVQPVDWVEFNQVALEPRGEARRSVATKFGPVSEQTFDELLDLDTSRKGVFPPSNGRQGGLESLGRDLEWMQAQGFDILAGANSLETIGVTIVDLPDTDWDGLSPADLLHQLRLGAAFRSRLDADAVSWPATFGFRTREGGTGMLQWVSLGNSTHGATVRIKLLRDSHAR